ncbi:hypothetical protein GQ44DRAFT_768145 [Phaeosphaeriaceae sp. PMI808]|nr:hypothetical protein GQ44DRAFT_768145 [Phaeosphaeriaceae sp. PMI808]
MSKTFGKSFDNLRFEKIGPSSRFMQDFENAKRDFGTSMNVDGNYEISLVMSGVPNSSFYDTEECTVILTGEIMKEFFDSVVVLILQMLHDQIANSDKLNKRRAISRIVLVGGFGDSMYLLQRVREWSRGHNLLVTCPEHPQVAIARGAALRGLESIAPIRRRSRRHYGIFCNHHYIPGVDPEEHSYYCHRNQRIRCDKFDWLVEKGQIVDENTKIVLPQIFYWKEGESFQQSRKLFSSTSTTPPLYGGKLGSGLEVVGQISHTFTRSDLAKFKHEDRKEGRYWVLRYNIEMYMGTKQGTLRFAVESDGKEWGSAEIEYDDGDETS